MGRESQKQTHRTFRLKRQKTLSGNVGFDLQVDMAIQDGAGKTKVDTQDFRLKPQKTLFGYDATEKVEGWLCRIFEANGRMTAMEHMKVPACPHGVAAIPDTCAVGFLCCAAGCCRLTACAVTLHNSCLAAFKTTA